MILANLFLIYLLLSGFFTERFDSDPVELLSDHQVDPYAKITEPLYPSVLRVAELVVLIRQNA
jgi:hypothetical protein